MRRGSSRSVSVRLSRAAAVLPELRYELRMQLIARGRTICKARMPLCSECVLFDVCPTGARLLTAAEAR